MISSIGELYKLLSENVDGIANKFVEDFSGIEYAPNLELTKISTNLIEVVNVYDRSTNEYEAVVIYDALNIFEVKGCTSCGVINCKEKETIINDLILGRFEKMLKGGI